jgi:hypothetical protein
VSPGQTAFSIGWEVSPGHSVSYQYDISIVGPPGTSHH